MTTLPIYQPYNRYEDLKSIPTKTSFRKDVKVILVNESFSYHEREIFKCQ